MTSSSRLVQLFSQQGQSPWLDNLKRSLISSGELVKVRETGIRGLTSNPTIFQKAIQGSADYDEQFQSLIQNLSSIIDSYWAMVLQDIHGALDVFARSWSALVGCRSTSEFDGENTSDQAMYPCDPRHDCGWP
jgi:transaldolase